MNIGRRIYYEIATGNVLVDTGERSGSVIPTTITQDITAYKVLNQRVRSTFNVIELPFGTYAQDFKEAYGYRVNPSTKKIEFTYSTTSEPEVEVTPQPPLSEKIEELEAFWMYDSMMKDLAIEESNAIQADLMYQLMQKGVL